MKHKKRILAVSCAAAMLLSCTGSLGFAADADVIKDAAIVTAAADDHGIVKGEAQDNSKTAALTSLVKDINTAVYTPAKETLGAYTPESFPTDKPYAYIDITKDGKANGDEVEFNVVLKGVTEGMNLGAIQIELPFPEGIEITGQSSSIKDSKDSTLDLNYDTPSRTLIGAYAAMKLGSELLFNNEMVLCTVQAKLTADLTEYKDINLSKLEVSDRMGDVTYVTPNSAAVVEDKFGGAIEAPGEVKNVETITFNFTDASGAGIKYGTDYVFVAGGTEMTYEALQAKLTELEASGTGDSLNDWLKTVTVSFKNEGKFSVAVKYENDAADYTDESSVVTPKPPVTGDPDDYIDNLKSKYESTLSVSSKNVKKKLSDLAGSTFMSALKKLQDSTLVKAKVDAGTGLYDVKLNGIEKDDTDLEDAIEYCETVADLYDVLTNPDNTVKINKKSTFEMELTFTDATDDKNTADVTVKTSYKISSSESSTGGSTGGWSDDDDDDDILFFPGMNTNAGGIVVKVNPNFNAGTVTPVKKANDQFVINTSGASSATTFDPIIAKVPYQLNGVEEEAVVVDKNGNVIARSAYIGGNVAVALKNFGSGENYKIVTRSKTFADVGDNFAWAKNAISGLAVRDIVKGVDDNTFEPDRAITRAEFVKLVTTMFGIVDGGTTATFTDVAPTDWYSAPVAAAQALGIAAGYEDGSFKPNQTITREEMCTMLQRAAAQLNVKLKEVNAVGGYADDAAISAWAKDAVYSMQAANVMNGVDGGRFDPANNTTRAQAAVAIYNMLKASLNF